MHGQISKFKSMGMVLYRIWLFTFSSSKAFFICLLLSAFNFSYYRLLMDQYFVCMEDYHQNYLLLTLFGIERIEKDEYVFVTDMQFI